MSEVDFLMKLPFDGMLPAVLLNDHFYVARRTVARALFDQAHTLYTELTYPLGQQACEKQSAIFYFSGRPDACPRAIVD